MRARACVCVCVRMRARARVCECLGAGQRGADGAHGGGEGVHRHRRPGVLRHPVALPKEILYIYIIYRYMHIYIYTVGSVLHHD